MTVDGIFNVVGSYNWDAWSHSRNLELTVAVVDRGSRRASRGLRGGRAKVRGDDAGALEGAAAVDPGRALGGSVRAGRCSELLSKHTRTLRLGDETVSDETKDRGEEGAEDGGQAREEGEGVERG